MPSAATSISRTPGATASTAAVVTASPIAAASSINASSPLVFTNRQPCISESPSSR